MRHIEAIYGEDLDDLLSVIADLHYRRYAQDKVQISSHDPPDSRVAPLVRALIRAEAKVLVEKAETGEETHMRLRVSTNNYLDFWSWDNVHEVRSSPKN